MIGILYVDDEENSLIAFKAQFRLKYTVYIANSAKDGLEILKNKEVQIVIADQRMPSMTGVEFLILVAKSYPMTMRILLTGYADMSIVIEAVNKGKVFHYLSKPWNSEEMEMTIDRAYQVYEENKRIDELNRSMRLNDEPLSLLFNMKEFNKQEVVQMISFLSEMYVSVGGDALEIVGIDRYEFSSILEPAD